MDTPPARMFGPMPDTAVCADRAGRAAPPLAKHPRWRYRMMLFVAVLLLYVLPGLIGHDPWKQDETYITEIVRHMVESGDWTVPTMAGAPFMEKPPLFYWVAAACAALFSPLLPLHDGARIASGLFVIGTCSAVAGIGHRWWGACHGRISVLALLSCLGMMQHAHFMLTDMAMMMGFAVALFGLSLCGDRWGPGGLLLGVGVGIGFLGKGLLAPGVIGVCALLLPLLFPGWRRRDYALNLGVGLLAAAPWLLIWPVALFHRSPQLFIDWFWINNIGRFVGFSVPVLGAAHSDHFWMATLPWFTFPAFPLAALSLWRHRATALSEAPFQVSMVLICTLMAVLGTSASARDNYALPILLPIALLAAPAAAQLPDLVDRCWHWTATIVWGVFAAFIWATWAWMMAHHAPPSLPLLADYLPQQFAPKFQAAAFVAALAFTIVPTLLARHAIGFAGRGLAAWFTGLTVGWAVMSTLWLPWIDEAKSYRSVFASVKAILPTGYKCVAQAGMGESELAMLSYFLGIRAVRMEARAAPLCGVLLVNGAASAPPRDIDPNHWVLAWQGARPGDRTERFWLYTAISLAKKVAAPGPSTRNKPAVHLPAGSNGPP